MSRFAPGKGAGEMRYKGNLVLLELLITLAFFAVSAVIGTGVLARAYKTSVDSRRTTDALFIAQSWAERIADAEDLVALLDESARKDADGYAMEQDGYSLRVRVAPEETGAGTLYDIRLSVSLGDDPLVELPASRYVPGEVSP